MNKTLSYASRFTKIIWIKTRNDMKSSISRMLEDEHILNTIGYNDNYLLEILIKKNPIDRFNILLEVDLTNFGHHFHI